MPSTISIPIYKGNTPKNVYINIHIHIHIHIPTYIYIYIDIRGSLVKYYCLFLLICLILLFFFLTYFWQIGSFSNHYRISLISFEAIRESCFFFCFSSSFQISTYKDYLYIYICMYMLFSFFVCLFEHNFLLKEIEK